MNQDMINAKKKLRSKAQIRHFVDRHLGLVSGRGGVFFYVRALTLYTGALASLPHWLPSTATTEVTIETRDERRWTLDPIKHLPLSLV
jgi:hypothetical protein